MKTTIQTIPHSQQRYDTCGDWYDGPNGWQIITVSELGNPDMEFLEGLHEFLESYTARRRGITPAMVDLFDFKWSGEGEPGDDPQCPVFEDHQFATQIEKLAAERLGVDWEEYDKAIENL